MIRRAVVDDAYTLARLRVAMWDEMNPELPSTSDYREQLYVYWYETIEAGTTLAWLAEEAGRAVGMVALLLQPLQPQPPQPTTLRHRGYVSAVYVVPEQRRHGHGRALMEAVIGFAHEQGLQRLELRTSDQGRPLYTALGFTAHEVLMLNTGG